MSSVIGALRATLGLDSAAFEKGANATEKRAKGLQRNLESVKRRSKGTPDRRRRGTPGSDNMRRGW